MIKNYFSFLETAADNPFYIFGSEDSQDYDILVSVNEIPQNIDAAHNICKYFNEKISKVLTDKPLNCNIAIFNNGEIIKVFKGTEEELNNVIYYTYNLHKQFYPNPIKKPIIRDVDEKILRVARFLITFYSRTELRPKIKAALRGNLKDKLEVLKLIDYEKMISFPDKKELVEDIYKVIAFQYGQVFSLIDDHEKDSYTKSGIIKNYPDLSNLLRRKVPTNEDLKTLNRYLKKFISLIESRIRDIRLTEKI